MTESERLETLLQEYKNRKRWAKAALAEAGINYSEDDTLFDLLEALDLHGLPTSPLK
jgi:hypothetical protein